MMVSPRTLSLSALFGIQCLAVLAILGSQVLYRSRAESRRIQCGHQMRTVGHSLTQNAETEPSGLYCSGAPDLRYDGSVDVTGWVADGINSGRLSKADVSCPDNPVVGLENLNDQLNATVPRAIYWGGVAGSADWNNVSLGAGTYFAGTAANTVERQALIARAIVDQEYNTNYTASWHLVRCMPRFGFDDSQIPADIVLTGPPGQRGLKDLTATMGPMKMRVVETAPVVTSLIPFLGDSAPTSSLAQNITFGPRLADSRPDPFATDRQFGQRLAASSPLGSTFTDGPASMQNGRLELIPGDAVITDQFEAEDRWEEFDYLQDTRAWRAVHYQAGKLVLNLLMADGSVKCFQDLNRDTYLNPGFNVPTDLPDSAYDELKYRNSTVELPPTRFFAGMSLIRLSKGSVLE